MRWFQPSEWLCKCSQPDCDAPKELDPLLAERLDELRDRLGRPVIISSGLRCAHWNRLQGGEPNSRHCIGRAVDLRCTDSRERYALLAAIFAWPSEMMPFLEISPHHIHMDLDYRTPGVPMLILGAG